MILYIYYLLTFNKQKAPFSLINTYIPQDHELSELDPATNIPIISEAMQKAMDQLEDVLGEAVKKRMTNIFGERSLLIIYMII